MKANTKYNLKCIFGSLISNDSAIASAKTLPWWAAIIAFCLGVFLPIIPVLVSNCNSYGSSNVVGVNYGLDRNVTEAMIDLHNKNGSLIINEGSYLEYKVNGEVPVTRDDTTPIGSYTNTKENQYEFDIFYTARPIEGPDNADLFIKELGLRKYKVGTKELCLAEDTTSQVYTPSFIVFHNEEFALQVFKHNTATSAIQFVGDYKNTEKNVDLVAKFLSVPGFDTIPATLNELGERQYEYISGVFSNFKVFMDQSYLTAKGKLITIQTCIFLGIYAGLVLFLGLLMFLLTRGKKNFNRYLKWYQCMFISFWSSVSPGILALIFSFLMPNMSLIFFIMFMGVRAMWIAMKQLSPTYSK